MITVIFPKKNRLINKVFNTIKHHENDATPLTHIDDVLGYILNKLGLNKNDGIEYKVDSKYNSVTKNGQRVEAKEQYGQYIRIIDDSKGIKTVHYVFFSSESGKPSRNGYIISKLPISYREYYKEESPKTYSIFLLSVKLEDDEKLTTNRMYGEESVTDFDADDSAENDYQTFVYRLCKTLEIPILNFEQLDWSTNKGNEVYANKPFKSIKEMKDARNKMIHTNNESSYIIENADDTIIYGKTFGNNGFEVILLAAAAKKITKGTVYLWQIKDTNTNQAEDRKPAPISKENLKFLKCLGIDCFDELKDYKPNKEAMIEGDARNQLEFTKNLMLKYGSDEKECYLCKCNIQKLIIASHIHRVCDINNEMGKSFEKKREMAVSGDNGIWLCANHDKLFENGIIYFDKDGEMRISENSDLTSDQIEFIKKITNSNNGKTSIDSQHFNEQMQHYIALHRKRTHPELGDK